MRIATTLFLAAAALGGAASSASAETFTSKTCAVQLDLPAGWKADAKGEAAAIHDAPNKAGLAFVCTDVTDQAKLTAGVGQMVDSAVTDFKPDGKPKPIKVNGMDALVLDGHGKAKANGKMVGISALLIRTANNHGVITLTLLDDDTMKASGAAVLGILKSIKPVK